MLDASRISVTRTSDYMSKLVDIVTKDGTYFGSIADGAWTDEVKSSFIESLLVRLPLPPFMISYAGARSESDPPDIIDGRSRIEAVVSYMVDEYRLTGTVYGGSENGYEGKLYTELPRNYKRKILEAVVVWYTVMPGVPEDIAEDIRKRWTA